MVEYGQVPNAAIVPSTFRHFIVAVALVMSATVVVQVLAVVAFVSLSTEP